MSANIKKKRGYAFEIGTRPLTPYRLTDSPVALASWLLDSMAMATASLLPR